MPDADLAPQPAQACASEPETFGPYELQEVIGRGGMGEIYRAYDTGHRRVVALKRLPTALAGDPGFQARFRAEAALAARLHEPHVIPIHSFGEIDGRLYIDMRLVEGPDLAALLRAGGALPPRRVVDIVAQVASALDAAHAAGLVHRDIKPGNILVVEPGADGAGGDFVYVADFGIARALDGSTSGSLTSTGTTVGSMDYIAPERFGTGHGDERADIYALGCVLYEALTAQRPFPVEGLPAIVNAHLNTPPPAATALCPEVPAGLDAVIARAMAKDPGDRHPTAAALAADARAALEGVATGPPASAKPSDETAAQSADAAAVVALGGTVHPSAPAGVSMGPSGIPSVAVEVSRAPGPGDDPSAATALVAAGAAPAEGVVAAPRRGRWARPLLAAAATVILLTAGAVAAWPQLTSVGSPHPAATIQTVAPQPTTPALPPSTVAATTVPDVGSGPVAPRMPQVIAAPSEPVHDPPRGTDPPPLRITTKSERTILVGTPWSFSLKAAGGAEPYTWAITDGAPPTGIEFHPPGELSGTVQIRTTASFTVRVTDAAGAQQSRRLTIRAETPPRVVPDVTGQTLAAATLAVRNAGFTNVVRSGGTSGTVIAQSPPGGATAEPDDPVTLSVGDDPAPVTSTGGIIG